MILKKRTKIPQFIYFLSHKLEEKTFCHHAEPPLWIWSLAKMLEDLPRLRPLGGEDFFWTLANLDLRLLFRRKISLVTSPRRESSWL